MPGYDRSRIVGESEEDLEEFICGICLQVLIKPTFTQCCGQTFCFDCINQWLQQQNTCPNDRKRLTTDQLISSPKMVINLLGNLKLKCEDCETVVKINDLDKHKEGFCFFNPYLICENCGEVKCNHSDKDCIENLVTKLDDLQKVCAHLRQKNDALEKSVNSLLKKHAQLTEIKDIPQIVKGSIVNELIIQIEKLQIESNKNKSLNYTLKNNSNNLSELEGLTNRLVIDKFIGKWELRLNDNQDTFLKELGCKVPVKPANILELSRDGDSIEIKYDNLFCKFKLNEEYEVEQLGQKLKAIEVLDGNKLIKRYKVNGIDVTVVREIFKDFLIIVSNSTLNILTIIDLLNRLQKQIT